MRQQLTVGVHETTELLNVTLRDFQAVFLVTKLDIIGYVIARDHCSTQHCTYGEHETTGCLLGDVGKTRFLPDVEIKPKHDSN